MDINGLDLGPEPAHLTGAVQLAVPIPSDFDISLIVLTEDNESECGYAGRVNHIVISDSDSKIPS